MKALALVVLLSPQLGAAEPLPSFNARVLDLIATYPARGFGGYAWPARRGTSGTTRNLRLGNTVVAQGGQGNHCVGVSFEVFWRALEACDGGARAVFDARSAARARLRWYVPDTHGRGPAEVLPAFGLGRVIAPADALPGDFVQAWNRDGTFGHSMVFLGWDRDAGGNITGIRYWSSQPWTDGIDRSEMPIGDGGFDLEHVHIARAACRSRR